jgi:hypothetical protein
VKIMAARRALSKNTIDVAFVETAVTIFERVVLETVHRVVP